MVTYKKSHLKGNYLLKNHIRHRKSEPEKIPPLSASQDQKTARRPRKLQTKLFLYILLPPLLVLIFFALFFSPIQLEYPDQPRAEYASDAKFNLDE